MKSRFGDELLVDSQFLWFAKLTSSAYGACVPEAIHTALNLAASHAARNGVYVKSDFDNAKIFADFDELRLIHSILDTILGSARVQSSGAVLHVECRLETFRHSVSLSIVTFVDRVTNSTTQERFMQDILEREYLQNRQEFAEFEQFKFS